MKKKTQMPPISGDISSISVEGEWVDETTFVATMKIGDPLPKDMPDGMRDAMIMMLMSAILKHKSAELKQEHENEWEVEEAVIPIPTDERSH